MFIHLPVILFIGGGAMHHRLDDRGGGFCIGGALGQTPPALRDMVNKRAVRILLECIPIE